MKIIIPSQGVARQVNKGELSGDFFASWGLDLDSNKPKIRVSPRLVVHTTSDDNASMVAPVAFVRNMAATSDIYFALCSQAIFTRTVADLGGSTFVVDGLANSPTSAISNIYSDMVTFNGALVVSLNVGQGGNAGNATLARLAGTWNNDWYVSLSGSPTLTQGIAHPLCVGFTKELLIGNGNVIASVTPPLTVNPTRLTLDTQYEVQWIRSGSFSYWIGARHKFGGEGKIFKWDGASQYVTGEYGVGTDITFAGVLKDEVPYTVNGNGQLLGFNGGGFSEVARFPIADDKVNYLADTVTTYPFNINRNGICLINNNIHILISAALNESIPIYLENMLSGIWEFTPETGLYHKYGISKDNDATNIMDFGSPILVQAGALFSLGTVNHSFLAGASLWKNQNSGTPISVINYIASDAIPKMGYFITPKVTGQEADEMWQSAFLTFKKLINSGEFIKLSYRRSINFRTAFTGTNTWSSVGASTTTFTTTSSEFSGVSVGDEIEVLSGEGSGLSAHITAISLLAGTYTVTIDFVLTGASGTFTLRVANWTKISSVTDLVRAYEQFPVGKNSEWIQFKCVMYGTGSTTADNANSPEISKLFIVSKPQVPVV